MGNENASDTNCNWCAGNSHQTENRKKAKRSIRTWTLQRNLKKTVEHEGDSDTNFN